jgi:tetratricopeptide (TPR) repeat protein
MSAGSYSTVGVRPVAFALGLVALTCLMPVRALGQEPAAAPAPEAPAAPPEDARERFRRGEAAYQKGNYPLAITEWEAAYSADPRPRIQYNLYQAHERLGALGEASDALQRYLSTADPDDPYARRTRGFRFDRYRLPQDHWSSRRAGRKAGRTSAYSSPPQEP